MWCLVLAALTLPPEFLALEVLADSPRPLASVWVSRMDATALKAAAGTISEYPVEYRRALLAALAPEDKAQVWRRVASNYIGAHPTLAASSVELLREVEALAVTSSFVNQTEKAKSRLTTVANSVRSSLGEDAYRELFLAAGPVTVLSAEKSAALPVRIRLAGLLRSYVLKAATNPNCNCYQYGADCGGPYYCSAGTACDFWYIGCGIWYQSVCDGYCTPIPGSGEI